MNIDYIAGFFDGEGSVAKCSAKKSDRYSVTISQTNFDVLDKIRIFFGVGSVYKVKKRKSHWKDAWIYRTTNRNDTLQVLKKLESYLLLKKEIANEAINYIENYVLPRRDLKSNSLSEDEKVIISMINNGKSYRQIEKILKVGRQTICRIKKKSEGVV